MGKANDELRDNRLKQLGVRGRVPDRLTQSIVDAAQRKPIGQRYTLPDGEVPGLLLEVGATGASSFALLYRNQAKTKRRLGLGNASALPLDEARKRAREALAKIGRGVDPAAERQAARGSAEEAERSTVRAYLANVYGPKVLAHQKGGGAPTLTTAGSPATKPSGSWARILFSWKPILDLPIAQLSRDQIEKVLADRKTEGMSAGTLLRDWSAFRALLADAVDRGVLAGIPMSRRPEPIRKTRGNQRIRWLGQHDTDAELANKTDERTRFSDALESAGPVQGCTGEFLRFASRLALATGLRRGEIVRLSDRMLNLRERTLTLPAEITKSNKSRTIYLNDAALAAIRAWPVRGTSGELFPGSPEVWEDRITQQGWPALCDAAGIKDLHFHDLRHDFAVRMLRSGATLAQVRDALGHASITQTEKYAHTVPSDVRRAVLALQMA